LIVELLLSPLTYAFLAGILLPISCRAESRILGLTAGFIFGVAALVATPFAANFLVASVEQTGPFKDNDLPIRCRKASSEGDVGIDAVVFLTGGFSRSPRDISDFGALSADSLNRAFSFVRLPIDSGVKVLISGGGPYAISEAEIIARLLVRHGFDRNDIELETNSRNTLENARNAAAMLLPARSRVILATDALHMARAAYTFEQYGFQTCRLLLGSHYIPAFGLTSFVPQVSALGKSHKALYEIAGNIFYRITMWINPPDSDN